ncbi:Panacea domain-containing protein [Candidatus Mycalebacterium sp.]
MVINERKVAEMAAYFLLQVEDGAMSHLKLMKLLYLSDRESFLRHGFSISGDQMVSMPHGPVLSGTLNLMNGTKKSAPKGWNSMICPIEKHTVSLVNSDLTVDGLLQLSRAEEEVLDSVWKEFGHMNRWQIRDHTHKLPEYEDPGDSSVLIKFDTLFSDLGFSKLQARHLKEQFEVDRSIERVFSKR